MANLVYASNTPAEHKDRWQTPIEIFSALDVEFGFYLDAAADHGNALCARYLTEQDNALAVDWESYGAIWCNPPYSAITPWVEKAAEQCRAQNQPIVMLLPADTSTGWFSLALQSVDEVRLITDGRLAFIEECAFDGAMCTLLDESTPPKKGKYWQHPAIGRFEIRRGAE